MRLLVREEKEPKPKLFVPDIFRLGRGLHAQGWGPKSSICASKPVNQTFGRDIPGFCWDIPAVPEKFERKLFAVNSCPLFGLGTPNRELHIEKGWERRPLLTLQSLVHRIAAFAFAFAMAIPRCQWRHRCVVTLGGGAIARPRPVVSRWATVFGLVIILRYMYGYVCMPIKIVWLCLFSFVCSVFALVFVHRRPAKSRAKSPLRVIKSIFLANVMLCSFGAVPVTGGAPVPSVLRSPKVSPLRGGAAHGPLHPALFPSNCWSQSLVSHESQSVFWL